MSSSSEPTTPNRAPQPASAKAAPFNAMAPATLVNRTHRVLRQRAKSIEARRQTFRSLWIPLTISGGLLLLLVSAIWSILDQYELAPTGLPDANQQMLVLMIWCLPISVVLAVLWFQSSGSHRSSQVKVDRENHPR